MHSKNKIALVTDASRGFGKDMALAIAREGIGANIVAPDPIKTDFNNAAIGNNPQFEGMLGSLTPLGRVGAAEDIGGINV